MGTQCCNCRSSPAKHAAVRCDDTGKVITLLFCDSCHDLETYPCGDCREDLDIEWIKKTRTDKCPSCGGKIGYYEEENE
jgi:DNA-directed RNA polymerase subunit RPC12/RpoP